MESDERYYREWFDTTVDQPKSPTIPPYSRVWCKVCKVIVADGYAAHFMTKERVEKYEQHLRGVHGLPSGR